MVSLRYFANSFCQLYLCEILLSEDDVDKFSEDVDRMCNLGCLISADDK